MKKAHNTNAAISGIDINKPVGIADGFQRGGLAK